jgi:hypothetical protein
MAYIGSKWEKSELVSRRGLVRWYMGDSHNSAASIVDSTGLGAPLVPIGTAPTLGVPLNGNKGLVFDGATTRGMLSDDPVPGLVRYALIIAKYDPANFAQFAGLASDKNTLALLVGSAGTPYFFNLAYGNDYSRNRLPYAMTAAPGPVGGLPAVVEWSFPSGGSMNGVQLGEDRNFGITRTWSGTIYEILLYNVVPTPQELLGLSFYTAMKYQIWDDYDAGGTKIFPFPSDWSTPITESKSVLMSRSISGVIKQRYKTQVPKRSLEVVWDNGRRQAEIEAARAFHNQHYGSKSFIYRDYTNDPATDLEAFIMSEIQYRKAGYQRGGYSFAVAEK